MIMETTVFAHAGQQKTLTMNINRLQLLYKDISQMNFFSIFGVLKKKTGEIERSLSKKDTDHDCRADIPYPYGPSPSPS
ncbi:MAG TPA: hypothetical protein DCY35_08045 [Prolixibacteraceae bacterium]|nr:hypothetical protein [Prolixibacteraceae bacterium]